MRLIQTLVVLSITPLLGGCLTDKLATDHYDECAPQTSSFQAMVDCGKQKRAAYCKTNSLCGQAGDTFTQYADALAMSVKNKEMSEAEARLRFAEFKMGVIRDHNRNAAIAAASGPSTCMVNGNVVNCF